MASQVDFSVGQTHVCLMEQVLWNDTEELLPEESSLHCGSYFS